MSRFIVYSLLFIAVLVVLTLDIDYTQAALVGSPASLLEKGQWDFALEGGYISRRPLELSGDTNYETSIFHGFHSRSYGLTDRITITGRGGGTFGYLYDESTPGDETRISLSGGFGLGLQLKTIIFRHQENGWEWDASGQFLYMRSHHKRSGKADSDWYEWQAATCLAKEMGRLKPYAGVKFSIVDLDRDDGKGNKDSYEEDGNIGPFVGTDIYFGVDRDIVVYVEASFLMGNEFYGGIRYRF